MKTLLKAAQVVCLDAQDMIFEPGYLLVADGRIHSITSSPPDDFAGTAVDLGNKLIMPGLVNAHTHSPMVLFRGLAEGHSLFNFEGWYNTIRMVEEVMTPEMIPAAVLVSCAEMIRTGTTTFADQYFWMEQIVPAVRQSGLRAALGYGVVELGEAEARQRELAAATQFLQSVAHDPLIQGWVGPHAFFIDNSEAAMAIELDLAMAFNTGFHIHLSTSGEEDRYCLEKYGRTAIQQLAKMGMLEHPILAAHCLTVPPEDYPLLADVPFTAVINPSSAMRNAAGVADACGMLDASINLALGTDNVTNNNSYDMFKEMQIVGKLMALHHRTPNALPTRTILHMATLGGAQALGLADEIGSLEPGKQADLITLDLDEIGWTPRNGQDVYTALVYGISGMHVRDVMVAGKWLLKDGRFQTINYPQASQGLERSYQQLSEKLSN
ncbi:amidohydrolase family protein [Candidatus Leptofilum sp.]|uniref:amidohydrolase family protein n=1 Tax=Candidatus Leptofilum sp. TaxID=3241576 RepID=UPI003B5CC137